MAVSRGNTFHKRLRVREALVPNTNPDRTHKLQVMCVTSTRESSAALDGK